MPSPNSSYTTCKYVDPSKALIRSIQVLQDGGKWVIYNERLPHKQKPLAMSDLPKESFETNVANFESHFDENDRNMIEKNCQS